MHVILTSNRIIVVSFDNFFIAVLLQSRYGACMLGPRMPYYMLQHGLAT
jgi:hypothetical protein